MQLKLQILSTLSSTSAGEKDLGNIPLTTESSSIMNEGSSRLYRVLTGVSNQAIDLAGLAGVNYIVVKTDQAITLRLNGANSIPIAIPTGFAFGWLVLSTTGITALDITNASGETAKVIIQLGGDV